MRHLHLLGSLASVAVALVLLNFCGWLRRTWRCIVARWPRSDGSWKFRERRGTDRGGNAMLPRKLWPFMEIYDEGHGWYVVLVVVGETSEGSI